MAELQLAPDAHHYLGIELNQQVWKLLGKEDREAKDEKRMERFAQASLFHWQHSPRFQPLNAQRGHWLLARVYTVLERTEEALHHAGECLQLTEALELKGFDLAYAHEGMARAQAAAQDTAEAASHFQRAREAGEAIAGEEDRKYFADDLASPPWFGMELLDHS